MRPMMVPLLEKMERLELAVLMAALGRVWRQGYGGGHADALRGRYLDPGPPDDSQEPN